MYLVTYRTPKSLYFAHSLNGEENISISTDKD